MATGRSRLPHEDRTATEPRENQLHDVVIDRIELVNQDIKVFQLKIKDRESGVKFHPGQWLDVHIPLLPKAGGFTITSTPSAASPSALSPSIELAIQRSPSNPPAQWMWRDPPAEILGRELKVRVGGSFTWPPFGWSIEKVEELERVVFVAGGVGINPLISMLSHIHSAISISPSTFTPSIPNITFLYSTKPPQSSSSPDPSQILFLPRLQGLVSSFPASKLDLKVFLTGPSPHSETRSPETVAWFQEGRIKDQDLLDALDGYASSASHAAGDRRKTVCYVCGPPGMTDETVAFLGRQEGMSPERVFCEKWW